MKKILLMLFTLSFSFSFGQSWLWGGQGYGDLKANTTCSAVATDKDGNAYSAGFYATTLILGNDTLIAPSSYSNAYLVKYNSAGSIIWTRTVVDTTGLTFAYAVATDKSGNIYLTGIFHGNAKLGTFNLANAGYAVFTAKYDASGNVLWAKQANEQRVYSVATDKFNNVFITGYTSNNPLLPFLIKYDSNGNVLWTRTAIAPSNSSYGFGSSVCTDNSGNAYITGWFGDTLVFGADSVKSNSYTCYLVKYSSTGNVVWAKHSKNNSGSSNCMANAVITDRANNIYLTGQFQDTVNFGSHALYTQSKSVISTFFTKYDTNGNAIWAKESSSGWEGTGLASDAFAHIYLAGILNGNPADSLEFGSYQLANNSSYSSFLMNFDTAGNAICGSVVNNASDGGSLSATASDSTGNYVYMAGIFIVDVVLGPDSLPQIGGGDNVFVGRWQQCNLNNEDINEVASAKTNGVLFPNPNNGQFTIELSGVSDKSSVEVYNVLGEKVYSTKLTTTTAQIDLRNNASGIYLYRVLTETGNLVSDGKFVIQK